jgi:tetratricopeptide (TPR) repeat protein
MTPSDLIENWIDQPSTADTDHFFHTNCPDYGADMAEALKNAALQAMRNDTQQARGIVALLHAAADYTQTPRARGYALWAEAVVRSIGLSEFAHALTCYDRAIAIFAADRDELSQATMQISRLWSLTNLGRHEEAFDAAAWAGPVLAAHGRWFPLATLHMNTAIVYNRLGDDAKALATYDRAQRSYEELGEEGELWWAQAEHNRAMSLRNLGRFQESMQASERAHAVQMRLDNKIEAARAMQELGVTYFVLGRYNEALRGLRRGRSAPPCHPRRAVRQRLLASTPPLRRRVGQFTTHPRLLPRVGDAAGRSPRRHGRGDRPRRHESA